MLCGFGELAVARGFGYSPAPDLVGAGLMAGLVIANWKMHGSLALIEEFSQFRREQSSLKDVEVVLCALAHYLGRMQLAV